MANTISDIPVSPPHLHPPPSHPLPPHFLPLPPNSPPRHSILTTPLTITVTARKPNLTTSTPNHSSVLSLNLQSDSSHPGQIIVPPFTAEPKLSESSIDLPPVDILSDDNILLPSIVLPTQSETTDSISLPGPSALPECLMLM